MRQAVANRSRGNGHGPTDGVGALELEPPRSSRRVRVPELLVGAAVTVAFALAAVLWQANSTQRTPALAVATNIERGQVIEARDIRVAYLGTDDSVATLSDAESDRIVGRVAVVDLPAGTLLTPSHVTDLLTPQPGDGVVGLALDPGQFPATGMAHGDVVNVVAPTGEEDAEVLAEAAVVFATEDLGGQGRSLISLLTSEDAANRVAAAAERGPVRLVLVSR